MIKIKSIGFLLILALTAACGQQPTTGGSVSDNEENRLAAAKQYLEVAPAQDLLMELTRGVAERIPEDARKSLEKILAGKTIKEQAYQITLKALVKHFTVNEIKAMTSFYRTPEGQSIRKEQSLYMAEVMTGLNMELLKEFKEIHPRPPDQVKPGEQKAPETGQTPQPPQTTPGPPDAKPGLQETQPAPPSAK